MKKTILIVAALFLHSCSSYQTVEVLSYVRDEHGVLLKLIVVEHDLISPSKTTHAIRIREPKLGVNTVEKVEVVLNGHDLPLDIVAGYVVVENKFIDIRLIVDTHTIKGEVFEYQANGTYRQKLHGEPFKAF